MGWKRYLVAALLGGTSLLAVGATFLNVGVASAEEPQGVKLRQDSARGGAFFATYRSHRGGGLRGGK